MKKWLLVMALGGVVAVAIAASFCKYCDGTGFYKDSNGQRTLKCIYCNGTGKR